MRSVFLVLFAGSMVLSCASHPQEGRPYSYMRISAPPTESADRGRRTDAPPTPEYILGKGAVSAEKLGAFLAHSNPEADADFVQTLARLYVEEAAAEGVNHDIAFAQMCLETGFLRYGNLVTPDMNNFCGLGAISADRPGERFPEPRIGVRAQIQHLKGYATTEPLAQELVDPRYIWVKYGSSPTIRGLAGSWASDPQYADKISRILERLYAFSFGEPA